MPQATKELRDEWGIDPSKAVDHLEKKGFTIDSDFCIIDPEGYEPTEEDFRAIDFLIQEWDFQ